MTKRSRRVLYDGRTDVLEHVEADQASPRQTHGTAAITRRMDHAYRSAIGFVTAKQCPLRRISIVGEREHREALLLKER
jgi:hypothetical protein